MPYTRAFDSLSSLDRQKGQFGETMRSLEALGIAVAIYCIAGCSAIHKWEQQSSFGVAAADLNPELISDAVMLNPSSYPAGNTNPVTSDTNKNYLGLVVKDSEAKCGEFVSGLVLAQTTVNTGLDMITTVFSALATAFTPVNTIHALAAGATISSGWKTAINSDIYSKATIGNYAQAIQASYYTDIGNYVTALTTASSDKITPSIEVSKILAIHKECSLASAQSTISSTLQSGTDQSTTTQVTTGQSSAPMALTPGTTPTGHPGAALQLR